MGEKRRKLLIVLTALLLPLHFVRASSDLVIELTNGKYAVFNLQEKPVLTMAGTKLLIKTSSLSTDYERTDVVKFYFQDTGSTVAIEPVQEKEVLRIAQDSNGRFLITDFDAGDEIIVSDVNGHLYRECISVDDRTATIDLSSCHHGIYIIKIGKKQTIKITWK